jgi:spore coat protein U-like protein
MHVRKSLYLLAAVALLAPMAVRAQVVNVSATIANSAAFTGSQDLDFGTVDVATGATVDPQDMANNGNRTLTYNYALDVSFTGVPANLQSGTNNLPVSLTCDVQEGASWQGTVACSGNTFSLSAPTASTTAVVGIGGSIAAADAAAAPAGTYSGTITINVTP